MAAKVQLVDNVLMPMLSYGTYRMRGEKLAKTVNAALRCGYRSFDTAQAYGNEEDLGKALDELLPEHHLKREDIFITTKIMPEDESKVSSLVKDSIERLNSKYVDMVLLQYPMYVDTASENDLLADDPSVWSGENDNNTVRQNQEWRISVWHAMEDIKKRALVRSIGVANFEYRHLEQVPKYCHFTPAVNQVELHPHHQRPAAQRACKRLGIHLQAYAPLGRQQPALMSTPTLLKIAAKHHCSVQQLMLAWALHKGIGVVPRSNNEMRIESNIGATKLKLSEQEVDEICEIDEGKRYTKINAANIK